MKERSKGKKRIVVTRGNTPFVLFEACDERADECQVGRFRARTFTLREVSKSALQFVGFVPLAQINVAHSCS